MAASGGRGTRSPAGSTAAGSAAGSVAGSVAALVTGPLSTAGFDVEDVRVRRSGTQHVVLVAVDRDGGVDLDAVAEASRLLSGVLDEHDADLPAALGGSYVLEVSSRGAGEPLALPRHWRRAAGRLVRVERPAQPPVVGRVVTADDDGADLEVDGVTLRVTYAEVTSALVQLEFRPPPRGPAEADGDREEPR